MFKLPKVLVLMRHGQTTDVGGDNRGLTEAGKRLISRRTLELPLPEGRTTILTSRKPRALQTAKLVKAVLKRGRIIQRNVRVNNIDRLRDVITNQEKQGICPAETYLNLDTRELIDRGVETPKQFTARMNGLLTKQASYLVVIVSHEVSLETYLISQRDYKIRKKTFDKYFGYGNYAILDLIK